MSLMTSPKSKYRVLVLYLVIAGLFVISGAGFWNNILLFPKLAQVFSIDFSHARWIQVLYSLGYLVFALPSALFHRKYGYKIGMMVALALVSIGPFLIYPALTQHGVAYFLLAVVLMGAGWSMLETSLNPLVVEEGQPETAVRRLNFMQAFFPVGVVLGYAIGRWFYPSDLHLSFNILAEAAARPYVVVGLVVLFLAFLIDSVEFPLMSGKRSGGIPEARSEMRNLFASPSIKLGLAAIFCCIAIQSTLQGAAYMFVMQQYAGYTDEIAQNVVFAGLIIFGIGRFVGTALMGGINPNRLLLWSMGACLAFTVGAWALGGTAGLACLMATNLCVAIGYPTVFATTVRDLRSEANVASGLLVTASALAGLIIPLAMNYLIEATYARVAILMALPCFPVMYVYVRHVQTRAGLNEQLPPVA